MPGWGLVTADSRYIKTGNDGLLARNEGGGRTPTMRSATYKTAQGCQLHTTAAVPALVRANHFVFVCVCSCVHNHQAPKGVGGVQGFQAARVPQTPYAPTSRPDKVLPSPKGVCVEVLSRCRWPSCRFPAGRHRQRRREIG